ncbi:MAG: helix-turn-helix transcriptional regulator [Deltaproteobacteria bacterium]|nr:helix-turn-helix transcriptional regulator [Deltaproteobacteria bacterium]
MQSLIFPLLEQILITAKAQGLSQKEIALRAGISPEALSRAKKASDIQLSTLVRLAGTVGLKVTLAPDRPVLEKILSGEVFE